ncbi:hypothetical protein [Oceanirhabdus seepicola]|uniref:Flagellar protein FliT n=1 Tax=Oceanirhabdus seepicola TaxID=2828781 RepID=A0A9J6NUG6_9CLOT|nr:hypothetical protein [Oceanirhabdus seepicola]MCM1988106.1 hypothetical protein [Oceanirhabdus seepicola]
MNLEELYKKYKQISQEIISALEKEDLDALEDLLFEREEILKNIMSNEVEKERLQELYTKYDLFNIDKIMKEKFNDKIHIVKQELNKLRKRKQATRGYNNLSAKAVFLSKRK